MKKKRKIYENEKSIASQQQQHLQQKQARRSDQSVNQVKINWHTHKHKYTHTHTYTYIEITKTNPKHTHTLIHLHTHIFNHHLSSTSLIPKLWACSRRWGKKREIRAWRKHERRTAVQGRRLEEEEAEDNDGAVQLLEAVGDTKTDVVVFSSYTTIATTLYIYIYIHHIYTIMLQTCLNLLITIITNGKQKKTYIRIYNLP